MLVFKEGVVDNHGWSHWRHQFQFAGPIGRLDELELYDWCLHNLEDIGGWHILHKGIIIFKDSDAMAFKLGWM